MSSSSPRCTGKIGDDDDDDDAANDVQSSSRLNVVKESIAVRWCVRVSRCGSFILLESGCLGEGRERMKVVVKN